ncbi:hypothetical protein NDU88_004190 [Pleurodeles waltl]|uniref:Uncharacterized protein n=1 Tax=Pleurodeles waltl TaxID=8319 RepID=A0AAV7LHL3_PLEWA|nr:hypothetical protein NDU88_004190 [Pleurodeles waltl]
MEETVPKGQDEAGHQWKPVQEHLEADNPCGAETEKANTPPQQPEKEDQEEERPQEEGENNHLATTPGIQSNPGRSDVGEAPVALGHSWSLKQVTREGLHLFVGWGMTQGI